VTLRIDVSVASDIDQLVMGYGIKDRLGHVVYGTNTYLKNQVMKQVRAGSQLRYEVRFPAHLGPGTYSIQTALTSSDTHLVNNYEWKDLALVFTVVNLDKPHFVGLAWIDPSIEVEFL
jgi:lipopolysaccharide transport system ATP-binding protein